MSDDLDFGQTVRGFVEGQVVFGRYKLRHMLGRGGMGVVWLARDEQLEEDVALKFLPDMVRLDAAAAEDLKRETRKSRKLTHANIVRIHDFAEDGQSAAIAMEYVDGGTLGLLRLEQPGQVFKARDLEPWLRQLADALDYAHGTERMVHRDLKPANLMINSRNRLKVADFGISSSISDSVSRMSIQRGGSPPYMSPQQMRGEAPQAADDIYSVGAMLYELLTGKPPFYRGNIYSQAKEAVPPAMTERRAELLGDAAAQLEPIPAQWESVVASCLAKSAEDRPASMAAIVEQLYPPIPATAQKTTVPAAPGGLSKPARVGIGVAVFLLLAIGGVVVMRQPGENRVSPVVEATPAPARATPPAESKASLAAATPTPTPITTPTPSPTVAAPPEPVELSTLFGSSRHPATGAAFEGRVAFVDMNEVFTGLDATKAAEQKLNGMRSSAKRQYDAMVAELKDAMDEIKALELRIGKSPSQKLLASRDQKIAAARELDAKATAYKQTQEKYLQEQFLEMRKGIIDSIMAAVRRASKVKFPNLILDTSGLSMNRMPLVCYQRSAEPWTQALIRSIENGGDPFESDSTGIRTYTGLKFAVIDFNKVCLRHPAMRDLKVDSSLTGDAKTAQDERILAARKQAAQAVAGKLAGICRDRDVDVVLDSSGYSMGQIPIVLASGGVPDLTEDALSGL